MVVNTLKRVIYMSKAWIAALLVGMVLAGCGGGGSGGSESATQSGSLTDTGSSVAVLSRLQSALLY